MLRQWLQQLHKLICDKRGQRRTAGAALPKRLLFRPNCENLECRLVPASFKPTFIVNHHLAAQAQATPAAFNSAFGYTPSQLRTAYGVSGISFAIMQGTSTGQTMTLNIPGNGAGQTIAIVDAYNDPAIFADVESFDRAFGADSDVTGPKLSQQFGAASSFLTVYDQNGNIINPASTSVPVDSTGNWETEEALDVEWAHALAPGAKIALVVCNSNNGGDMNTGVAAAAKLPGVSVVSMSWGSPDANGETASDSFFTTPAGHQGVTFLASTGDQSIGLYPAYSPNVVAVGGTTLYLNANNSINNETGWSTTFDGSGTGGGTSQFVAEPTYQQGVQATGFRTSPDVSFDADPNTGVAMYDSYLNSGWMQMGGTSLACPAWGGIMAIVNQGRALQGQATFNTPINPQQALAAIYKLPTSSFHDITQGSITANSDVNRAGPGYDQVTGLGTPVANLLVPALASYVPATQLAYTTQPQATVLRGASFSTVVQLSSASGAAVAQSGVAVTITLSWASFAGGGTTMTATTNASGQASFNVIITTAGVFSLNATSFGLTHANSNQFYVTNDSGGDWFSQHMSDPGLQTVARTDFLRDHSITYADMLELFAKAESEGAVTASMLSSLQVLPFNATTLKMTPDVNDLANKVIFGDAANATYQTLNTLGNVHTESLGNLHVGSSATHLTKLVNKWFLGMNEPADAAYYQVVSGNLFGPHGPLYTDVEQGALGDCTVLASMAETAARDNVAIENMFTYYGTNVINSTNLINAQTVSVWAVRFFHNGTPTYVTVDSELPAGGNLYDHPFGGALWVAVAEKAYAELNQSGWLGTLEPGVNSYGALDNGNANTIVAALQALTGKSATSFSFDANTVVTAMAQGKLVVLATGDTVSNINIEHNHAYAVVGYNASAGMPFTVFNPWGMGGGMDNGVQKWGQFTANGSFLAANFVFGTQTLTPASQTGVAPAARFSDAAHAEATGTKAAQASPVSVSLITGTRLDGWNLPGSGANQSQASFEQDWTESADGDAKPWFMM